MSTFQKNLILVIIFGLTLPLAVVLSTRLATKSFERVKMQTQTLSIKGTAEKEIKADCATWQFTLQARDEKELKVAFAKLDEGKRKLMAKLQAAGVKADQLEVSPAQFKLQHPTDEKGNEQNKVEGYIASQAFTFSSTDVALVSKAALEAGSLLGEGIELEAGAPCYLCNNLSDLKIKMLAEATANARERAAQLMGDSGVRLGMVASASQGVFQITAKGSVDSSAGGEYDTATPQKTIRATVTLEYALQNQ